MTRKSPNETTRVGTTYQPCGEFIAIRRQTRGTETSKYPEEKKANSDSPSSGERTGNSLNHCSASMLALLQWGRGVFQEVRHGFRRVNCDESGVLARMPFIDSEDTLTSGRTEIVDNT